jgi:dCTP deaminase
MESVRLNSDTSGTANPKSSTGRLDVLTRLITDGGAAFDRIEKGYRGKLYLEIAPLSFSIVVRPVVRLNQVRFQVGRGPSGAGIPQVELNRLYEAGQLIKSTSQLLPLRDGNLVPVTVDLRGSGPGSNVGFKAKKNTNRIDVALVDYYDPRDFWEPIIATDGHI